MKKVEALPVMTDDERSAANILVVIWDVDDRDSICAGLNELGYKNITKFPIILKGRQP